MKIIMKMKSSDSPCPLDQVSMIVLKRCPIPRTYLWKIMEFCWKNKYFPTVWKNGITVLICKKQDPAFANVPANFRPITSEPVIAKVFTSLIRNRIYSFTYKNNYIESHIQKGFWQGISGTVEHTELMSYLIDQVRNKQRSLVVTLLDLRNAFGEVLHELIKSVLPFHNIPSHIEELIDNVYQDFRISIATKGFVTEPVIVHKGVKETATL